MDLSILTPLIWSLVIAGLIYYATYTFIPEGLPKRAGYFVAGVIAIVALFVFLINFLNANGILR